VTAAKVHSRTNSIHPNAAVLVAIIRTVAK
jgi:hypothetical protein